MAIKEQYFNNPLASKAYGSLAKAYLPKTATGSIAKGFKPIGGLSGAGIGIGAGLLSEYLKPKLDQPIMGGGDFGHITDAYKRRLEGNPGIASSALKGLSYGTYGGPIGMGIGAAAGAIGGMLTKNANTAYSDFLPTDVPQIITKAYQQYLGRDPEAGAVEGWMRGQGWKPGDKGVGQYSVLEKLKEIRDSPEAAQFRGINTTPTNAPSVSNSSWRPAPINIPAYFQNNPQAQEIARRIQARSR